MKYLLSVFSVAACMLFSSMAFANLTVPGVFSYDADFVPPTGYLKVVDDIANPQYMVMMQKDTSSPTSYNLAAMQSYVAPTWYAIPTNALRELLISSDGSTSWIYTGDDWFIEAGNWSHRVSDPITTEWDYYLFSSVGTPTNDSDNSSKYFEWTIRWISLGTATIRLVYTSWWSLSPFDRCDTHSWSINIPYQECIGLAYLYTQTDGDNWVYNDGWFGSTDLNTWGALNIFDWHIVTINLAGNNLSGSIVSWLQNLSFLRLLDLNNNELTTVNLSGLTALQWLYLNNNELTTVDLSGLTDLQWLDLSNNELTTVNLSGLTALQWLYLNNNELTTVDLSGLTALQWLHLSNNELTTVDLSGLTALRLLDLSYNELTTVDLSGLTALQWLYLNNNELTTVDLSGLTDLQWLDLSNNELTTVDLSGLTDLQWLDLSNNELTTVDISNNLSLEEAYFSLNQINDFAVADLSEYMDLASIDINENGLCGISDTNLLGFFDAFAGIGWEDQQIFCAVNNAEAIAGDASATITWGPPYAHGNTYDIVDTATIVGYTLSWFPHNGTMSGDNAISSFVPTGLINGVAYNFTLCVIHDNDDNPRTICVTFPPLTPTATVIVTEPSSSGGWGGGGWSTDNCPNWDKSGSYYDGKCDGTNPQAHSSPELPKLKINQIAKKDPIEFCKAADVQSSNAAFEDVQWTTYKSAVDMMVKHCLVQWYSNDGKDFGINNSLKRGELYKIFTRMWLLDFDLNTPWLWWSYGYKTAGATVGLWAGIMDKDQSAPVTQQELLQVTMNYLKHMWVLDESPTLGGKSLWVTRWEFAKFINTVLGLVSTR